MENFSIKEIDIGQGEELNNKEQYWIQHYNTYGNGYNATLGGDGKILLDYDEIIKTYLINHNAAEVARTLGCSVDSVYKILKANNIPTFSSANIAKEKSSKKIVQYDKNGNFIREFGSVSDACNFFNKNSREMGQHIGDCANEKRKSAYGYIWRWGR